MEHVCKACGTRKSIDQFNKIIGDGPLEPWNIRQCKSCAHKNYEQRYATPKLRKALITASKNWKKNNPEKHAALAREYRAKHPDRIVAQNRLNYAVRKGRIQRLPCEVCGTKERVHAHHVSYDPKDWYNVRWLCGVCHELEHG